MGTDPQLRLLQFADGLFPAGGHAHSFGLETYVQDEKVRDRAGLESFLRGFLDHSAGPCDAVVVAESIRLGRAGDLGRALALDAELDAMRPAAELRDASRQMGRQTLRVATALTASPVLQALSDAAEVGATPAHHPLVFGLAGGVLGWSARDAARAYLHSASLTIVSAALRLFPLGQLDGQRTLWAMGDTISLWAAAAESTDVRDVWSFTPGLDIAAMRHSRLEARLFRS